MQDNEFTALVERHRRELLVHCYRMVGSIDEAEDLTQETFLRAWKKIDGFQGRSSVRAWLYRIATNACLDALDGRPGRVLPDRVGPAATVGDGQPVPAKNLRWLQPLPDEQAVQRETIELAVLAAIQLLSPKQRAVLILRDLAGWSARETALVLDLSVAAVNSASQRARAALREHLPEQRSRWTVPAPSAEDLAVLRRYMRAVEGADLNAMAALLADEVRALMPPYEEWYLGRDNLVEALRRSWAPGMFRLVEIRANGRPGVAAYRRSGGGYRAMALGVVSLAADGRIGEIIAFHEPALFPRFGLPDEFSGEPPSPSSFDGGGS